MLRNHYARAAHDTSLGKIQRELSEKVPSVSLLGKKEQERGIPRESITERFRVSVLFPNALQRSYADITVARETGGTIKRYVVST